MSFGKWNKPSDAYIKEIIALRNQGHSWSAIGRHFGKEHTTIMYHYRRWAKTQSKTTKYEEIGHIKEIKPSWNGTEHLCCRSFIKKYHYPECPNVKGVWQHGDDFKNILAKQVSKYDERFDEPTNLGRSYQQYNLK